VVEPWFFEVLPCRPAPYADECLSSYVARLASANGMADLWSLASDLFPQWRVTRQLDLLRWEYPVDAWGRLPLRAQLPLADLNRLTVLAWVAKFRTPPVLLHPFRHGPGTFLMSVIAAQARICPLCLQVAPYIRLGWRFAAVQVCLEHGCQLQDHCHGCGAPLRLLADGHAQFHCAQCQTDWRSLPVVPAADEVLTAQCRQQAGLRFLLDPTVTLVNLPATGATAVDAVPRAVGLKFRYLRTERGASVIAMARQLGVAATTLSALECGRHVPLRLYGRYRDAVGVTWPEVAALTLTPAMLEHLTRPPHLALRQCPNPCCPAAQTPPGLHVTMLRDLPDQRLVRLRCTTCGRRFTRTYDGRVTTKPPSTRTVSKDPARWLKSPAEIQQLIAWGRAGQPNRWIAQQLGWGEKTVRTYWLALEMETEVHQAQANRRADDQAQHRAALREQIDAILATVFTLNQEVALRDVARQLGYNADYLHAFPDLVADVQDSLTRHNAQVQQRREVALTARMHQLCAALSDREELVTLEHFLEPVGCSKKYLQANYPDLAAHAQQAVQAHQRHEREARRAEQLAQIDAAARRLSARGIRLTQKTILAEADMSPHSDKAPVLQQRLQQWVGNFPWNE